MKNLQPLFKTFVLVVCLINFTQSFSQDLTNNAKLWFGTSVNYKIDKNFKAKFGALYAHNTSPSYFSFAQFKLGLSYKIKRRMYLEFGYKKQLLSDSQTKRDLYNITPGLFNKLEFDRIYLSYSFKHDLVERVSLKHEIEYENFFPAVQKYHNRYIYSAKLSYNIRRSSFSPFIENQIYYYAGGEISNGIKRHRIKTGVNFKPIKDFAMSTSIYHIYQNEFNTEQLSENDYSAFAISLNFNLN